MLVFEVEDCGASWEALTLAGVRVVSSVFRPPWGGGRFFVVDPDNYLIEVEELA
jgi:predicted enzyme related to lactoylglutathione lyase